MTATVLSGTIRGLLVRNGSGKTTLLSTIAAFRPPSGGSARLDGEVAVRLLERLDLRAGRLLEHLSRAARRAVGRRRRRLARSAAPPGLGGA